MKETSIAKNRARLIARDQIASISSKLNQIRVISLGFEIYEWSSSNDGRERESHKLLNGMYCKYIDVTVYIEDKGKTWKKRTAQMCKFHPGQDICCRCIALPISE